MELVGNVQLVGGNSASIQKIMALLEEQGIKTEGNPDVYVREYASFGVEEARELASKASSRALSSSRRTFIIVTPTVTNEAQNALLKTLEEPAGDALFFLVVPSPLMLLPTLRSRAQILDIGPYVETQTIDPRVFLKAKPNERLEMLKPLLDKDEDDKRDIANSITFLAGLEQELSHDPTNKSEGLEAVYRARKYIGDKGSLTKALLEQVALLI
jgi:DNA polymerase III, delta subunit